jgi:ATP-binding cassette subfamily B protein
MRLRDEGKTVILIAHRLSTVMKADKIYVMHKGAIAEEGSHEALIRNKGAYYSMWEQQFPMITCG